ncbi:MAG: hypothetical protein R2712_21060 [Vicinamibacterales bacterium]
MRGGLLAAALGVALSAAPAAAQGSAPALRAHRVSVSGGLTWTGGYDVGDAAAVLRGNGVGATPPSFTLLQADSRIGPAAGGDVRIGFALSPSLTIESGFGYSRPGLTTRVSADPEAAPITLDPERLSQFLVEAGIVWQVPGPVVAGRLRPFVSAGGGYLRQLYSERTLVETGRVFHAGGGMRYWLRGGDGVRRSLGLRGELRVLVRSGGVEFADRARAAPVAAVHLFAEL